MSRDRGWRRRIAALVVALVFVTAGVSSGHGAAAPPDPDPNVLSRLRAAETPGGEALLVGTPLEIGMEDPERMFPPVLVFDLAVRACR